MVGIRPDRIAAVDLSSATCAAPSSSGPRYHSRCSLRSAFWCCAASRPTCCRSARSISDLIVDATVIMVEAIFRRLSHTNSALGERSRASISAKTVMEDEAATPFSVGGGQTSRRSIFFRRRHHYRGVPAAVHPERRRRQYLQPDGPDLCLCVGGRSAGDIHDYAGAERDHSARACRRRPKPSDHSGCCISIYMPVLALFAERAASIVLAGGCRRS